MRVISAAEQRPWVRHVPPFDRSPEPPVQPAEATKDAVRRQSYVTCSAWMARVKDHCAHHKGHAGRHGSRAYMDRDAMKRRRQPVVDGAF